MHYNESVLRTDNGPATVEIEEGTPRTPSASLLSFSYVVAELGIDDPDASLNIVCIYLYFPLFISFQFHSTFFLHDDVFPRRTMALHRMFPSPTRICAAPSPLLSLVLTTIGAGKIMSPCATIP